MIAISLLDSHEDLGTHELAIFTIFIASLGCRSPFFTMPMADGDHMATALVLNSARIWHVVGGWQEQFCMRQTFEHPGDLNVRNSGIRLFSPDGRGYYVSFPPLAAIAAYGVSALWGQAPSPLSVRILNTSLHFLSAFFLIRVLRMRWDLPAPLVVVGVALYLLIGAHCWFFTTVYSWDTFWLFLVPPMIDLLEGSGQRARPIVTGVLSFLLVYSNQLALLYLGSWVLFAYLSPSLRGSKLLDLIVPLGSGACVGLGLAFVQYASIAGYGPLLFELGRRFKERSGMVDTTQAISVVFENLYLMYWMLPGVVVLLLIHSLVYRESRRGVPTSVAALGFTAVLIVAVLTNWSVNHRFALLPAGVFFSFAIPWLWPTQIKSRINRSVVGGLLGVIVVLALVWSQVKVGRIADTRIPSFYRDAGEVLSDLAPTDARIYVESPFRLYAPFFWYAGRNGTQVEGLASAVEDFNSSQVGRGVYYRFGESAELMEQRDLSLGRD